MTRGPPCVSRAPDSAAAPRMEGGLSGRQAGCFRRRQGARSIVGPCGTASLACAQLAEHGKEIGAAWVRELMAQGLLHRRRHLHTTTTTSRLAGDCRTHLSKGSMAYVPQEGETPLAACQPLPCGRSGRPGAGLRARG